MERENLSLMEITQSVNSIADNLLRISLDIGEGLLKSGAEIHRVEVTIEKICHSYGAEHVEVFCINSLIVAAVRMPDGSYSSQSRRIFDISNHLSALEKYNSLSREICSTTPDFDVVDEKIRKIKKRRPFPFWVILIGHMLVAGSFAIFFGGSWRDAIAGGIISSVVALINRVKVEYFTSITKTLVLSFISGILTCLSTIIGLGENMDMIAIGIIMLLIPGIAIGNAMRDLLSGDTLTGVLKTVHAFVEACMIAIGFALAIMILGKYCPEPILYAHSELVRIMLGVLSSAGGTLGFALIFKISKKHLAIAAFGGIFTYLTYELVTFFGANLLVTAFGSALFMALFSETCARIFRAPAIVFLFPCLIPIVPGSSLYYTMFNLIAQDQAACLLHLQSLGSTILGIAMGLSIATVTFGITIQIINKLKKQN